MVIKTGLATLGSAGQRCGVLGDIVLDYLPEYPLVRCLEVTIVAHKTNSDAIVIGDKEVAAAAATLRGHAELSAADRMVISFVDLHSLYFDSETAGMRLRWFASVLEPGESYKDYL